MADCRIYAAICLAVAALFVAAYALGAAMLWYTDRQLEETRARYQQLGPEREYLREAAAREEAIAQKTARLASLGQAKTAYYPLLAQLAAKTPPEVWLTDVEIEKDALRITGMAKSYPELVAFLQRLEKDDLLTAPVLVRVEQDGALPAQKFEMTVKSRVK